MWGYDTNRMKQGGGAITADSTGGAAWSDDESPVPVSSKDPVWGSRTAPVTIVVFSDFQCPFCSRVEGTLDQVKTTYGPDKVRMVWKNEPLPFHDKAKPSAEAAMAVFNIKGSDGFWKFHDTAFKNQQGLSADNYEKWAIAAGADSAKFKAEIATLMQKVEESAAKVRNLDANTEKTLASIGRDDHSAAREDVKTAADIQARQQNDARAARDSDRNFAAGREDAMR